MAKPNPELIYALRNAAKKLQDSQNYQWGHMGSCNCGYLVQEVTKLSKADIHEYAMRTRGGDWSEQALDFCPTSGYLMDQVISYMLEVGMDIADFKHLERLSDRDVLQKLPARERHLRHNYKKDVVKYMYTWADLLEEKLMTDISLSHIQEKMEKQKVL
ncbi:hypothetical protein OKW21_006381 [Catalinimonas alkaloidigena]|uniref:hypothetical protein n=1 Tax=Catalinimonas alkaloidigena TaxID=1075417 RepID=UPI002404D6F1|nr:hypothetical protein [Catalinimonas alkaloidigena]MDF9801118.1 hypothetical protein [Catalinimonas alkaloidigena]